MTGTDKASEPREQTKQIELTDRELTTVTGGGKSRAHLSEITITKLVDAGTPALGLV